MARKKIRVTNELIHRLETEGVGSLTRGELRALFRKGYVDRKPIEMKDGSVRYGYKMSSGIL